MCALVPEPADPASRMDSREGMAAGAEATTSSMLVSLSSKPS